MFTASLSFTTFDYFETSCNCILEAQVLRSGMTAIGRQCWRATSGSETRRVVIISSVRRGQHFHILRTLLSEMLRRGFTAHQKKAPKVGPSAARAC